MMDHRQQSDAISTGIRQGWLFGLIMLGIYLFSTIIDRASGFPTRFLQIQEVPFLVIQYGIPALLMLVSALVFLIGGLIASAKTGLASTGWIAGHVGGLVYGIGSALVYAVVLFGFQLPSLRVYEVNPGVYWTQAIANMSTQLLTIALFGGVFMGNLTGALGGLIGRGSRRRLFFAE